MTNKKFDFACIYYTNELIVKLEEEDFFAKNIVLPEKLRYIILYLVQNNYEALNKLGLSDEQMTKAIEHARKESYEATLHDMVKEGLVAYTGIDKNGEYTLEITEAGRREDDRSKEMIRVAQEIRALHNKDTESPKP
jgi:hypothetical protein